MKKNCFLVSLIILFGIFFVSVSINADQTVKTVHNTNRQNVTKEQLRCLEEEMERLEYCESCRPLGHNSLVCWYIESKYHGDETLHSRVSNEFAAAVNYCLK